MKKIFCCPALELFCCLPLWKTVLFVSSRAFSLSTPPVLLSTPVENSEATWKKATKCNKQFCDRVTNQNLLKHLVLIKSHLYKVKNLNGRNKMINKRKMTKINNKKKINKPLKIEPGNDGKFCVWSKLQVTVYILGQ